MTKNEKIVNRLISDYNYVTSLGHNVLGVFLQGSQNYHLDYEGSDIDTKVIIVPSFEDFCLNKKPVSTTLILPSNEHIDLKDIRLMHDCFRKQNINFLEILFTEYKYLNPRYADIYQEMFDNAEKIAHYNNYKVVSSVAGMVYEKRKALCHPYENLKAKIEKYGYDNKQLHHMMRCQEFLHRYINGTPYAECLIPTEPEFLTRVKSSYIFSLQEALDKADNLVAIVENTKNKYMEEVPVKIDAEVDNIMNRVLVNVLKAQFQEEIKND